MNLNNIKVHDIVRYGSGSSALMRVTTITSPDYVYGVQYFGAEISSKLEYCIPASLEEINCFEQQELNRLNSKRKYIDEYVSTLVNRYGTWAEKTFPKSNNQTILSHMGEELGELKEACYNLVVSAITNCDTLEEAEARYKANREHMEEEFADIFLLLCHFAHKNKLNITYEAQLKFLTNIKRDWETEINDAGHFKHVDK